MHQSKNQSHFLCPALKNEKDKTKIILDGQSSTVFCHRYSCT